MADIRNCVPPKIIKKSIHTLKTKEHRIEAYLNSRVKAAGGFTRKYTSPGISGVPDRIVFLGGIYFVETKRPKGGYLSKQQVAEIRNMARQGIPVLVITTEEEVEDFMQVLEDGKTYKTMQCRRCNNIVNMTFTEDELKIQNAPKLTVVQKAFLQRNLCSDCMLKE